MKLEKKELAERHYMLYKHYKEKGQNERALSHHAKYRELSPQKTKAPDEDELELVASTKGE